MNDGSKPAKSDYLARIRVEMDKHLSADHWTLKQKLALTCRMLARDGHASGLAGQITARTETPGVFWTIRLGFGFDEITAGNLIRCDDDLNPMDGDGMPNPATRFHLWVYKARADVNCIVHTHPPYCSALSMLGEPIVVSHMDTTPLHDEVAFLPEWPGVPVADEEGRLISEALGPRKRAILLAHHGQLVAADGVERAAVMALTMERAARIQLLARAAGEIRQIDPALAKEAHDYRHQPKHVAASFSYYARQVLREAPDCIDDN
ncbi:MAG: aldolase [Gammaproteobacteria bacterium]|nr:aldolase [Gammaproteobacteria bacterium]